MKSTVFALPLVRLKIKDDGFLPTQFKRRGVNPTKLEKGSYKQFRKVTE